MKVNSQPCKRKFVQCTTEVSEDAVRRESINGVEHIVISSATLPDDIVMNGGLYSVDEIEKSYKSLERTLAPIEHPTDSDGNFISANDPYAIHNFHAGAFNSNVRRENGRVWIDKVISVQEAMKTDRGKRLLDRVNEIETAEKPRPIHTSVGVWLEVEETDGPKTNAAGQEYSWIARNMVFDHDAILLDSVGAAQPSQGVGIAVNEAGDEMPIEIVAVPKIVEIQNEGGLTHVELREQLDAEIAKVATDEWAYIIDIIDEESIVIFEAPQGYYQVPYHVDNGTVSIVDPPISVDRRVTYTPKANSENKGDAMKEMLINALKAANIAVNEDWTDEQLLEEYNKLQANQGNDDAPASTDENSQVADIVANAVAEIKAEVAELKGKLNEKSEAEKSGFIEVIVNSGRYPGLEEADMKLLSIDKLKTMAANCTPSFGIPFTVNASSSSEDRFAIPTEMPE